MQDKRPTVDSVGVTPRMNLVEPGTSSSTQPFRAMSQTGAATSVAALPMAAAPGVAPSASVAQSATPQVGAMAPTPPVAATGGSGLPPVAGGTTPASPEGPPRKPRFTIHTRANLIAGGVLLGLLGLIVAVVSLIGGQTQEQQVVANQRDSFKVATVPLSDLAKEGSLSLDGANQLAINGQLRINNSAVITPSGTPSNPVTGQLYLNNGDSQLYYYNGSRFVQLGNDAQSVLSLGGAQGAVGLGAGLSVAGGNLTNTGVITLQGQAGAVTLTSGGGIAINGTQIANTGVTGVSGNPANGLTVSAATGAVQFSLAQSITTGAAPQFAGLTLANALGVSSGGTGATTAAGARAILGAAAQGGYAPGSVLVSDGTGSLTQLTPSAGGLCLVSDSLTNQPIFDSCSGGASVTAVNGVSGAVTLDVAAGSGLSLNTNSSTHTITLDYTPTSTGILSLNGLTGSALSVDDATASGSTITINTATTTSKGLAYFSNADFTVAGDGQVALRSDVIRNSNASNTSGGIVVLNPSGGGATVAGQCLLSTGVTAVAFGACPVGGNISSGTAQTAGRLTKFDATTNQITNSIASESGTTITVAGTLSATSLQGNGSSITNLTAANITGVVSVTHGGTGQNSLAANAVLLGNGTSGVATALPGAAGTCLVSNGTGAAPSFQSCGGVQSLNSFTGAITLQGNNGVTVTDDGAGTITINGPTLAGGVDSFNGVGGAIVLNDLDVSGNTFTIKSATAGTSSAQKGIAAFDSSNFSVSSGFVNTIQNIGTTATPTFGALNLQAGTAVISSVAGANSTRLSFATPNATGGATKTIVVPNNNGTMAVAASGAILLNATTGEITCPSCLTGGSGGNAGSNVVTSLNNLRDGLTIVGAGGLTVSDNGSDTITITAPTAAVGISSINTETGDVLLSDVTFNSGTSTFEINTASTTQKGLASFADADFDVDGSGQVTLDGGVTKLGNAVNSANGLVQLNASGFLPALNGSLLTALNANSISTGTLTVARGGTGRNTLTANSVLIGNGTGGFLTASSVSAGQCLVSTAGAPTFQACPGSGGVSSVNGNAGAVTLAAGDGIALDDITTPGTILISNAGVTQIQGTANQISASNGGTGITTLSLEQDISVTSSVTFGALTLTDASSLELGVNGTTSGSITFNSTTGQTVSLLAGAIATGYSLTLPTQDGTNGQCLQTDGSGQLSFATCLTGSGGGGGGVTSLQGASSGPALSGVVKLSDSVSNSSTGIITINTASTSTKGLASFDGTNLIVNSSGHVNTAQNITTSSSPQFAGLQITGTITVGTGFVSSSGAQYHFNGSDGGAVNATICTTAGNCTGSAGGGVTPTNGTSDYLVAFDGDSYHIKDSIIQQTPGTNTVTIGQGSSGTAVLASNGANSLQLNSGSNKIILGADTMQRTGTGLTLDLTNGATTTLSITNSNVSNVANLAVEGAGLFGNDLTVSTGNFIGTGATSLKSADQLGANNSGNITVDSGSVVSGTAGTVSIGTSNASAVSIGRLAASLNLQGSSGSTWVVKNTGNTNTTTIAFQAPGANVGYRFATAAAGSYDICTTAGNCSSGFTSTGTSLSIPIFNGNGTTVANSLLSQDAISGATKVMIGGNLEVSGDISGSTINGTVGINTGSGSGTERIDVNGNLVNIGTITTSGAINGATLTGGSLSGTAVNGLNVSATAVGAPAALAVSSGGSSALTLTSASGSLLLGGSTATIQRAGSGLTLDVNNGSTDSTLTVTNSGSGAANLSVEGGVTIGSGKVFTVGSTSGITLSSDCTAGQYLSGVRTVGGIVTASTCGTPTGTLTTLQGAYNNSTATSGAVQITTSSTNGGLRVRAGASADTATLLEVMNSGGTSLFSVDSSGSKVNVAQSATLTLDGGTGNQRIRVDTSGNTALQVTNAATLGAVQVQANNFAVQSTANSNANVFTVAANGAAMFKNAADSATAFVIQNAASSGPTSLFVVDTTNLKVGIGAAPATTGSILQVQGSTTISSNLIVNSNIYTGSGSGTLRLDTNGYLYNTNITGGSGVTAGTASGVLVTSNTGALSSLNTSNTGYCLLSQGTSAPAWGSCPGGSGASLASNYSQQSGVNASDDTANSLSWYAPAPYFGTWVQQIWSSASTGSYTVVSGDSLEYDVYCPTGQSKCDAGVLLNASTGNTGLDQNGIANGDDANPPSGDISSKASGRWYHRKIMLDGTSSGASLTGTAITTASLSMFASGNVNAKFYFRSIQIVNSGSNSVKKVFWNGGVPSTTNAPATSFGGNPSVLVGSVYEDGITFSDGTRQTTAFAPGSDITIANNYSLAAQLNNQPPGTDGALYFAPVFNGTGTVATNIATPSYTSATGDSLEYDVYCETGTCNTGVTLNSGGGGSPVQQGVDQNGITNGGATNAPTGDHGSYSTGRWYHRKVTFAAMGISSGTSISNVYLTQYGNSGGTYYFRSIRITNGSPSSSLKLKIWEGGKPTGTLVTNGPTPCSSGCGSAHPTLRWSYNSGSIDVQGNSTFGGKLAVGSAVGYDSTANTYLQADPNTSLAATTNGWNSANAMLYVAKDSGTNRSINAAGSVNASGADFAEWIPWSGVKPAVGSVITYKGSSYVVSSEATAAFVGNDKFGENAVLVTFAGQVPVRTTGVVGEGDLLVDNGDGTARAVPATQATMTDLARKVAIAQEASNDPGVKSVLGAVGTTSSSVGANLQQTSNTFTTLNVSGMATLGGLVVSGDATIAGDLTVNGHLVSGGDTPTAVAEAAAGTGATVTVSGNDTAGTITIVTGSAPTPGDLAKITFKKPYTSVPRVNLTPTSAAAAGLEYFYEATPTDMRVKANSTPTAQKTYIYTYFVIQ